MASIREAFAEQSCRTGQKHVPASLVSLFWLIVLVIPSEPISVIALF